MSRPTNFENKPIGVLHRQLKRNGDSLWQSACPLCPDGVLLVKRDQGATLKFLAEDNCISCGQRFIYIDIDQMRDQEANLPKMFKPPEGPREADMTISGIKLSPGQSLTVRVAIQSFAIHCEHAIKHDPSASNLYKGYMARINDLNDMIRQSAR